MSTAHCPWCWTEVRIAVRQYLQHHGQCDPQFCDPKKMENTQ